MHKLEPKVREIIESLSLPAYVKDTVVDFGADWTGEPAVWVYVIVADSKLRNKDSYKEVIDLAGRIGDAIMHAELGVWPFVRVRTQKEQAAIVAGNY